MHSPSRGLDRLIDAMLPGARVTRVRRLRGGLGARMHLLSIKVADGTRTRVVLRRPRSGQTERWSPERVRSDFEKLALVEQMGIAAPRPLYLDADGAHLGFPAMVLSYLPGRPILVPRNPSQWVDELARSLLTIHTADRSRIVHSGLPSIGRPEFKDEIARRREQARAGEPLAREVHEALETGLDRIGWPPTTLVHDDFWPGNTVWFRGHLVGIVDWTTMAVGDPRGDVSQCRVDLAIALGMEVADAFLEAYQSLVEVPLEDVWYFDLLRGMRALFSYQKWIPGYHDLGLTQLDADEAGERLRTFLRRTLEQRA